MNNTITITKTSTVAKNENEVRQITTAYFQNHGYVQAEPVSEGTIELTKSKQGLGMTPLKWAATVTIGIRATAEATDVTVTAIIDTTGQTVFDGERRTLDVFFDNFIASLQGTKPADLGELQKQTNSQVRQFFIRLIPFVIIVGVVLGLFYAAVKLRLGSF